LITKDEEEADKLLFSKNFSIRQSPSWKLQLRAIFLPCQLDASRQAQLFRCNRARRSSKADGIGRGVSLEFWACCSNGPLVMSSDTPVRLGPRHLLLLLIS
jgi:hypothetical protein